MGELLPVYSLLKLSSRPTSISSVTVAKCVWHDPNQLMIRKDYTFGQIVCIFSCVFRNLIQVFKTNSWDKGTFRIDNIVFWICLYLFSSELQLRDLEKMHSLIYVFLILVQTCLTHHISKID